jgi:arylsulfatase
VGTTRFHVDDAVVAEEPMRTQVGFFTLCGDGLCVGRDSSDPVSSAYTSPAGLTGASVLQVEVNLGDDQYVDLEKEAFAALARE